MHRSQGKVSTEVFGFKGRYANISEKITVFMFYFCKPDVFPGERLRCGPGSIFPGQFNIRAWAPGLDHDGLLRRRPLGLRPPLAVILIMGLMGNSGASRHCRGEFHQYLYGIICA